MKKTACYIDGFNLYGGIQAANLRRFLWLDLRCLAERLCQSDSQIHFVKYFTARILNLRHKGHPSHKRGEERRQRQSDFIDAQLSRGVEVLEGKFRRRTLECRDCGAQWTKPEEKMTDVQLATHLLSDAFRSRFDSAIVISGDADLIPPITVVVKEIGLPVIVAFPPCRILDELALSATGSININKHHVAKSQLPNPISHNGHDIHKPKEWT